MAAREREPARLGPFRIPREGGVYGVWTASLIFGILWSGGMHPWLRLTWLLGSTLTLLLVERVRYEGDITAALVPTLLYTPLLLAGAPLSLPLVALGAALLLASLRPARPIYGIVSGGTLLALHGAIVPVALSNLPVSVAVVAHEAAAVAQAAIAVTRGVDKSLYNITSLFLLAMLVSSLSLVAYGARGAGVLLAADALLRAALIGTGFIFKLKLKIYGFLEVIHSTTVLTLLSLLSK